MKNYYRIVVTAGIVYALMVLAVALITGWSTKKDPERIENVLKLNDLAGAAAECNGDYESLAGRAPGVDFAVLDMTGNILYSSVAEDEYPENLSVSAAIKSGLPYEYIIEGNQLRGCVIILDDGLGGIRRMRIIMIAALSGMGVVLLLGALFFGLYVRRNIYDPFQDMKNLAGQIADGKLDKPLKMDRNNLFGAFSESLDIMREELSASREREVALRRREKELVASLSHDLKTPITGIKLTCEVIKARAEIEHDISPDLEEKVDNIYKKADQIDVLVRDLFQVTMEDLGEFKVNCEDVSSDSLSEIIKKYDDKGLVSQGEIPGVLIRADLKCMSQVIGNIISNSYKYAGTEIEAGYRLVDEYLEMKLKDHGPGVPADELALITNKFYRGKQWAESKEEGSGLGLYIAKRLMEKMDGELLPESPGDGFCITLLIPLS